MHLPHLTVRGYLSALAVVVTGIAGQWLAWVSPWAWLLPAVVWLSLIGWEGSRTRRATPAMAIQMPSALYLGRDEHARLVLTGRASWRQTAELAWPLPAGLAAEDSGGRRVELVADGVAMPAWRIRGCRLGAVDLGTVHMRLSGPLGLSRWTYTQSLDTRVEVVPDILGPSAATSGRGRPGERAMVRPGSGTELHGLRDYSPGDPLRAVDWKGTARRGKPVVRLFDDQQALEMLVLVDAGRASGVEVGGLTRLHHFVNLAARLAEAAGTAGDRVGGLAFGSGVLAQAPMAGGPAGARGLRRMLQALESVSEESNPLVAALRARHMLRHRGLVVVLTDLTDAEAAEQMQQALALLGRKHLALVGAVADVEAAYLATASDGGWMTPYRNLAGQELLGAQALLAERLRRLGAHVVVESPRRLDGALLQRFDQLRRRRAV
ncbi:DUF58 domain-containing protein [Ectothiorhodospiraceae bacterium WFHF3C12]|nr:DUF58 domain-containing protein [Ectothiorhodospiraceae bacterium WFHF3C12]